MTTILIISTLISAVISFSIWKTWKWFEWRAWIEPTMIERLIEAAKFMALAISLAATAIGKFGISMQEARDVTDRIKLAKGGIGGEIWAKNHEGEFIVVEKIEVGEKKDGAWPITITGKPINGE